MNPVKKQLIGKMTAPGQKPMDVRFIADERPVLSRAEQNAGLVTVTDGFEEGDLLRYGAKADGITDDGVAVSDWLDVGMQGVTLTHSGGDSVISTWTTKSITSDIKIIGSAGSKLTGTTSLTFVRPEGGAVQIDGVEFDTWSQVIHNDVADSGTTPLLELKNCVLRDCSANGIDHERPLDKFVMENVRMYGMANYAVRIGRNIYAEQDNWKNIALTDVYIEDSTATGSTDASGFLIYGKNLQAENIHIGTITSVSGACWGFYTKVRYAQLNNILVENIVTTSGTDIAAVNIKGSLKGATTSPQGFTYVINNLTVLDTDGIGFKAQQQDVLASNIHIEEFGTDGITIDDVNAPNVLLNGFKVLTATAGTKVGVRVSNNAGAIKVKNGVIDGPSIGVRQASSASGGVGFEFASLFLDNCTTGMQINTNSPIDQVKVRDVYAGSGCTTGFQTSGTGAVTNLEVVDCDFSDATTPATIGGTLTTPKFRKVRGYVTRASGNASVTTGSTVSHGLASAPDRVLLTAGNSGITQLSATSLAASTFVLNHDGGGTETVYWEAIMDESE